MTRCYEFTFHTPEGRTVDVRGHGNTRRSAERAARRKLQRARSPKLHYTVTTSRFVPEDER